MSLWTPSHINRTFHNIHNTLQTTFPPTPRHHGSAARPARVAARPQTCGKPRHGLDLPVVSCGVGSTTKAAEQQAGPAQQSLNLPTQSSQKAHDDTSQVLCSRECTLGMSVGSRADRGLEWPVNSSWILTASAPRSIPLEMLVAWLRSRYSWYMSSADDSPHRDSLNGCLPALPTARGIGVRPDTTVAPDPEPRHPKRIPTANIPPPRATPRGARSGGLAAGDVAIDVVLEPSIADSTTTVRIRRRPKLYLCSPPSRTSALAGVQGRVLVCHW
mmetsp:Transcript_46372/g.116265  ORF Transcript_46372/g.116265 Transcript_46372/m.116265 type:complete len:273 (+) Transcript_46372:205-1023(+)|eukprot:CAMPEP_0173423504 /NCGR_PEP_ID=MMETSP1357-20121228/3781_1 /TAXON_ID=77926 /ORGANISM="Hemiselmis rufescens, Strain PCC563" /LENGTH=272 /DNA_ID=CAMNT_0014386631 /DNA_START=203 /DNA_END=1021 /DNA_ORIENTATION=-